VKLSLKNNSCRRKGNFYHAAIITQWDLKFSEDNNLNTSTHHAGKLWWSSQNAEKLEAAWQNEQDLGAQIPNTILYTPASEHTALGTRGTLTSQSQISDYFSSSSLCKLALKFLSIQGDANRLVKPILHLCFFGPSPLPGGTSEVTALRPGSVLCSLELHMLLVLMDILGSGRGSRDGQISHIC